METPSPIKRRGRLKKSGRDNENKNVEVVKIEMLSSSVKRRERPRKESYHRNVKDNLPVGKLFSTLVPDHFCNTFVPLWSCQRPKWNKSFPTRWPPAISQKRGRPKKSGKNNENKNAKAVKLSSSIKRRGRPRKESYHGNVKVANSIPSTSTNLPSLTSIDEEKRQTVGSKRKAREYKTDDDDDNDGNRRIKKKKKCINLEKKMDDEEAKIRRKTNQKNMKRKIKDDSSSEFEVTTATTTSKGKKLKVDVKKHEASCTSKQKKKSKSSDKKSDFDGKNNNI
ncbi:ulp1 protease family, C-terminal catalytic domain-containing protein [Tanacetum coccineum]